MNATNQPPAATPNVADLSDGQCVVCGNQTDHKCAEAKGFAWCQKLSHCRKDCKSVASTAKQATYDQMLHNFESTRDKKLTLIATILQGALIAFLENTWTGKLRAFEEKDGKLYIHEAEQMCRIQVFARFPRHLSHGNDNAKQAVLTQAKCNQPYACLYTLLVKLFRCKW